MVFIYTDKAPNLEKMADHLLAAADKVRRQQRSTLIRSSEEHESLVGMLSAILSVSAVRSGEIEGDVRGGFVQQPVCRERGRHPHSGGPAQRRTAQSTSHRLHQQASLRLCFVLFWVLPCSSSLPHTPQPQGAEIRERFICNS